MCNILRLLFGPVCLIIILSLIPSSSFAGLCGDANDDGGIDILDVVYVINYKYKDGPAPEEMLMADVNSNNKIDILDVVYLINYKYKDGPDPYCPHFMTPTTTTIIPEDEVSVIQNYDGVIGTITLDESSTYAQEVSVGDVITGQDDVEAPYGFLRKVTSKTNQGGSIVLETETATIMEAFETMDIDETHILRTSDIVSFTLHKGVRFIPDRADEIFNVDLACVLYDQDGDEGTTDDQIRLDGQYAFTAELFAKLKIKWFSLKRFEAGIETDQTVNLDLTANLQWEFNEAIEFDLAEFHLGAIPIGGAVWITPTLTIEAHIHGDLTVTFETGISYTQSLRFGFGYADDAFYDISESTKDFTYTPPELAAEFNFEPGVSLNASCLLYGVAGPYMAGKTGFHFQAILNADPCDVELTFDLDAILYAVVGIECDLLNFDYNKQFELYTHPIGEWVYPLGGTGTVAVNPEPDAIDASWTLDGPCGYSSGGTGDETLTNLDPGNYTVTWGAVSGWQTPANSSQILVSGQTLTFDGIYFDINTIPVLTTAAVTGITQTTAECGGNITSDGGSAVTARGVCWSNDPTPTVADNKTTDGTGTGSFASSLIGLTADTPYYVRAYATNSAGTGYGNEVSFTTLEKTNGTVTDIDGNEYQTVKIGDQWWMAENLKVTHYRNGNVIPNVTDGITWSGLITGAYCEYDNDPNNVADYGRMYNWFAVDDSRNIAPDGWHVATDAEWQTLVDYLGGGDVAGGKMKETGTMYWLSPNTGATNESGFSALPGGGRDSDGNYLYMRFNATFWSATESSSNDAWLLYLNSNISSVVQINGRKKYGFSIRCIKD